MNEEVLNMQVRKFLKEVGVTSQREIERAVRAAVESGALTGTDGVEATMTLEIPSLELTHRVEGTIAFND